VDYSLDAGAAIEKVYSPVCKDGKVFYGG